MPTKMDSRITSRGRRRFGLAVILAALLSLLCSGPACSSAAVVGARFSDVSTSHPYAAAIDNLAKRGIVSGYADGHFGPEDTLTRQQFAKVIVLAMGLTVTVGDSHDFVDVPRDSVNLYPSHYVAVAANNRLILGYSDGTFLPTALITRSQVIAIVVRAAGSKISEPPIGWAGILDAAGLARYDYVRKAEYGGLLQGIQSLATWDPQVRATRGEVAQLLSNLLAKTGSPSRLSVMTYGAKGDGLTDDSAAIQRAIDAGAAGGAEVYIPATSSGYLVRRTLDLGSGTVLTGEQSVLIMPSTNSYTAILSVPSAGDGSNIVIRGLVFRSTNDRARLQGYTGPGSNVLGIHLSSYHNVTIEDVAFENLEWGLKADTSGSQLRLVGARSSGTPQPLYVSHCAGGYFADLDFDRSNTPGDSGLWHHIYVSEGCSNLTFERLRLTGGASWAFQIYLSDSPRDLTQDITVTDLTLDGVGSGVVVCNGASQVHFRGITGTGMPADGSWFAVHGGEAGVTGVSFEDFELTGGSRLLEVSVAEGTRAGAVRLSNGQVDGASSPALRPDNVDELIVENVVFANLTSSESGLRTISSSSVATYGTFLVRGCTFVYSSAEVEPISLRARGEAEFKGNKFVVDNGSNSYVNDNRQDGTVLWAADNVIEGFVGAKTPGDTQTVVQVAGPD